MAKLQGALIGTVAAQCIAPPRFQLRLILAAWGRRRGWRRCFLQGRVARRSAWRYAWCPGGIWRDRWAGCGCWRRVDKHKERRLIARDRAIGIACLEEGDGYEAKAPNIGCPVGGRNGENGQPVRRRGRVDGNDAAIGPLHIRDGGGLADALGITINHLHKFCIHRDNAAAIDPWRCICNPGRAIIGLEKRGRGAAIQIDRHGHRWLTQADAARVAAASHDQHAEQEEQEQRPTFDVQREPIWL